VRVCKLEHRVVSEVIVPKDIKHLTMGYSKRVLPITNWRSFNKDPRGTNV